MATIVPYGSTVLPNGQVILPYGYGDSTPLGLNYQSSYTQPQTAQAVQQSYNAASPVSISVPVNVSVPGLDMLANALAPLGQAAGDIAESSQQVGQTAQDVSGAIGSVTDFFGAVRQLDFLGIGIAALGLLLIIGAIIAYTLPAAKQTVTIVGKGAKAAATVATLAA